MCGKESLTPSLVWQLCLDLWMNQRGAACLIGILPLPDARLHPSTRAGLHQPVEAYVKGREKARPSTWLHLKPPSRAEISSLNDFQVSVHSSRNRSVCRHGKSRAAGRASDLHTWHSLDGRVGKNQSPNAARNSPGHMFQPQLASCLLLREGIKMCPLYR